MTRRRRRVLVIGAGNAGASVAGRLRRTGVEDVTLVDPRHEHVFRPLQSHIAGGVARRREATRAEEDALPRGVERVIDSVVAVDADASAVDLASGDRVEYEHLLVCPGLDSHWEAVPGLREAISAPSGLSNYELDLAAKTSRVLRDVRSGTVVFVQADASTSCPGAAQKPMYLACDWWRRQGVLDDIRVVLVIPDAALFGVPEVADELQRKVDEYGIEVRFHADLLHVDAVGRTVTVGRDVQRETIEYDVLHVAPPQSPPAWIAASGLADAAGFVDVDHATMRHRRYGSVWSLGDAAELGIVRSGGAIRRQAKIAARNVRAVLGGREPTERYDGYSVCPFTVSRRTVVFAEFLPDGRLAPTIPWWPNLYRERRLSWLFDRRILPWVYWHMIIRGRA